MITEDGARKPHTSRSSSSGAAAASRRQAADDSCSLCVHTPFWGSRGALDLAERGKSDLACEKGRRGDSHRAPTPLTSEGRRRSIADAAGRGSPRPPPNTTTTGLQQAWTAS